MTREKQDQIFAKNAMLRQKIIGLLIAVVSMILWMALTLYDTKQIFWGLELFPLMVIGFHILLTDKRVFKELEENIRRENKNGKK